MKSDQTRILLKDVIHKNKTWGVRGERVKVISISGNAVIYERSDGKRYPCSVKDLS